MRALVIRHDHVSEPGHVGTRLVERGDDLTTVTVVPPHLHHAPSGPWLEWHYDRFAVPPGAVQLAHSEVGPQAFRLGRSLGVQFHPEATARMIEGWLDLGGDVHCAQQGIDPQELLSQARDLEPE